MSLRVSGLGATLLLWLIFLPPPAKATALPETQLLLEIWVNGNTHHYVAPVIERNGILFMNASDLAACNIAISPAEIPRTGIVAVNRLADVDVKLLDAEQKLEITAGGDRLLSQKFDLRPDSAATTATSDYGFIGSYNFVGTINNFDQLGPSTSSGATLGGTMFSPEGILTVDGFSQSQTDQGRFIRLDTMAEVDEPGIMRRTLFGDAVSGGLNWSRSVRFGGIQVATDFSLRPDLATMPLPAFFGQTAVPATVDVFVNAARVFETNIDSGPFQINNLPIITGGGQATIVTRDILGQETISTLPFYASSQLLQQGLDAYDFDLGAVRQSYGQTSFDYGKPATTGTYSVGVTNDLTFEAHGEAASQVQLAGFGAIFGLGDYGLAHVATAGSSYDDGGKHKEGGLFSVSAQSQTNPFTLFAAASKTDGYYADIATFGGTPPPTFQTQIGDSIGFDKNGSVALSWIESKSYDEPLSRLASASYTVSFGKINLGFTSFYDLTNHALVGEALLTASLGDGWIGNSSVSEANHSDQEQVGVIKPVNTDGGVGYQLLDTIGETDTKQGEVTWIGNSGSLDSMIASNRGVQSGRLTATGGIVAMDGSLYTTQYPNGAVALVKTGQPNIRVYRENREVATTDDDGEVLLTNFAPFTTNRISIDPRDYDLGTIVETTDKIIVPSRQSGVIVDMTPAPQHPVLLVLHRDTGAVPPLGAKVTLDDGSGPTVVGHDGEVYLADLHQPMKGLVEFEGGSCHFEVSPPQASKNDPIPRIDAVPCLAGAP